MLLVQSAGPALANHTGHPFGSTEPCTDQNGGSPPPANCISVGNSFLHYVYVSPLVTGNLKQSLLDTIWEDYDVTDLTMATQTTIDSFTDVEAYAADYGDNGVAGWVVCPPAAPQGIGAGNYRWCKNQRLRFNLDAAYAAFFADDPSRDSIACHELGHTLGLNHWGSQPGFITATCMRPNLPDGPVNLHWKDVEHLDGYY